MSCLTRLFALVGVTWIVTAAAAAAAATVDPEDVLAGLWLVTAEGQTKTQTLQIDVARIETDGSIASVASYGWTGGKLIPIRIQSLTVEGGTIAFRFRTPVDSDISVRSLTKDAFEGTVVYKSGRQRNVKLRRVDEVELAQAAAAAPKPAAVRKDSRLTLLYVGASNCPSCRDWERGIGDNTRRVFSDSALASKVEFREVQATSYTNTGADRFWPDDLKWVRDKTSAAAGTPRWIVLVDDRVALNTRGRTNFSRVMATLRDLVAKKGG